MKTRRIEFHLFAACLWLGRPSFATEVTKPAPSDNGLYEQSIKSTKHSIDREMIDVLYHDALDAYHDQRYDEALELLDKIYSLDPQYENVAQLRNSIRKTAMNHQAEANLDSVRSYMRKGDEALKDGQNVVAISNWKQALALDPNYEPAQKKIQEVNQRLAKQQFAAGYIHYHHGDLEDALDAWSNAIALDPTYKERGLLLLMSKIELQVRQNQISQLASQGYDQYLAGHLEESLQTYTDLVKLEPRHEEARRMSAKIKIQLGQAALKAARQALANKAYSDAMQQADKCLQYGYESGQAQKLKQDAQHAQQLANQPKPHPKPVAKKPTVEASSATTTATAPAPAPEQPRNPEEALNHYRKGLAAIRTKDYHLALEEFDIASQLDPADERIYMARERARQEWAAATGGGAQ